MNQGDNPIDFKLYVGEGDAIEMSIPGHAMQTVVTEHQEP